MIIDIDLLWVWSVCLIILFVLCLSAFLFILISVFPNFFFAEDNYYIYIENDQCSYNESVCLARVWFWHVQYVKPHRNLINLLIVSLISMFMFKSDQSNTYVYIRYDPLIYIESDQCV